MKDNAIILLGEEVLKDSQNQTSDFKIGVRLFAIFLSLHYQLLPITKPKKGWLEYEEIRG